MRTLIFGDIQGCFDDLQRLLDKVNYDPSNDRLGFVGDLVNRGPKSLETLRFIKALDNPIVVLGNHDLYCIAIGAKVVNYEKHHTLHEIFAAPDCAELIDWLRQQPILHHDAELNYSMIHAGIPPQWDLAQATQYADELHQVLISDDFQICLDDYEVALKHLFSHKPACWSEELTGNARMRYIINAFTRMRFCDANGCLDLENKSTLDTCPTNMKPWFDWPSQIPGTILFGHWAALQGVDRQGKFIGLDTGCVWGQRLTCVDIETKALFSVESK